MSQASVLVFDRDASTRAWYRAALASTDYRVAEAADGPEAVEVLASQLPDLVITELRPQHRARPARDGGRSRVKRALI
jgi:CheY-like chemotaxis protein